MYTAVNWALDLGLYAAVCVITCALWWFLGRRSDRAAFVSPASTPDTSSSSGSSGSHLTVSDALPLIYRRSKQTGALLPREENPDTPMTAEIPVVAAPASTMWRLPRALPLVWILYLAGLLIFTLLPLPSDPVAACAAIIHWDNYVPFGSFVAVADQFRDGESLRGTLYALSILLNIALFVPLGALAETTWRIRRMRRAPEGAPADGSRLARSIPHRRVLAWVAIGCVVSCLIELTQYTGLFGVVPCTYRVVDIDDVIMNTLGTYAGVRLLPFMARNSRFMGA
ncbi:VanZ family protein [Pauljensenia sp. UMB0018B]|uniref:Antibiotic resistance protein VanZ n=1 Tax=Schaalia odontolytica TaxID=1660 RepID=A0A2I1HYY8_9ACTO|nr:VanZ family protein [Schaalia odontolytica]MDK7340457.1 VanZ family protein [Pauljensenia sp. UMB0018B]PKY64096.1 antibiotic resistance protein VanZ [Schaalia odontolytica]